MAETLRLKVVEGEAAGTEYTVPMEGATLGRSDEADIVLPPKLVSRTHCRIACEDGEWTVADLGSRNGTYLNGETQESAVLAPGDKLRVGVNLIEVIGTADDGAGDAPERKRPVEATAADEDPGSAVAIVAYCDPKVHDAIVFTLREIIRKVPRGRAFDSHYLISELIRMNSDAYLRFAADHAETTDRPTEWVHKQLSEVVSSFAKLEEGLRAAEKESWSLNPYGKADCCELWIKL